MNVSVGSRCPELAQAHSSVALAWHKARGSTPFGVTIVSVCDLTELGSKHACTLALLLAFQYCENTHYRYLSPMSRLATHSAARCTCPQRKNDLRGPKRTSSDTTLSATFNISSAHRVQTLFPEPLHIECKLYSQSHDQSHGD